MVLVGRNRDWCTADHLMMFPCCLLRRVQQQGTMVHTSHDAQAEVLYLGDSNDHYRKWVKTFHTDVERLETSRFSFIMIWIK